MNSQAETTATFPNPQPETEQPDGYPSLTPLDRRFSRTNTPSGYPSLRGAARVAAANRAPRCIHVKASGVRCQAPALRGEDYCYFHRRVHLGPRLIYPSLSRLEDAHGIQAALMEVLIGTLDGRIDGKTAGRLLYGLQTAASNLKQMPELDDEDIVTEIPQPAHAKDAVRDPQADADAEKAAAGAGAAAALDHLRERHVIPGRSSGNSAQDGRFAEMMAGYYEHDPDAPPDRGDHARQIESDPHDEPGGANLQACNSGEKGFRALAPDVPAGEERGAECRAGALLHPVRGNDHADGQASGRLGYEIAMTTSVASSWNEPPQC